MFGKVLTSLAAISLVATPVAAQEAEIERSAAVIGEAEGIAGENGGLLAMFAVIAIIVGVAIVVSTDDDLEEAPTSP